MPVPMPSAGAPSRKIDVAGFTLVEVMVAMLLLSAATLGLAQLAGAAFIASRRTLAATSVGVYAENALEAARDRGFAGTTPGTTTDTLQLRGVRYARRVTIVDRDARTREVRVDVAPVNGGTFTYSTLTYVIR